ncbi:MAG: type II toxin-antitoxin system HicA family toxin [Armatimonadota bacterium]
MAPIPVCSGDEACRAFERLGWEKRRQSGSHMILVKGGVPAILSQSPATANGSRHAPSFDSESGNNG